MGGRDIDTLIPFDTDFDTAVAPGGYAWWYLDALSDCGAHGLTVIAFIGSVFSPYYAWARRRAAGGLADPLNHCAINVALYGRRGGGRWAMTERGARQLQRSAQHLQIGPSALAWDGDTLTIRLDEVTAPLPSRLRGSVRVHAAQRFHHPVQLAPGHRWCVIVPHAQVEVDLQAGAGARRWRGSGYLDSNQGNTSLEQAFARWDWSRGHLASGDSVVLYDVEPLAAAQGASAHAPAQQLGFRFGTDGAVQALQPLARTRLRDTLWRVPRHARGDAGAPVEVVQTLTDAPFYARSVLRTRWLGEPVTALHESLSLGRFERAVVQAMLPFRMPRRAG